MSYDQWIRPQGQKYYNGGMYTRRIPAMSQSHRKSIVILSR